MSEPFTRDERYDLVQRPWSRPSCTPGRHLAPRPRYARQRDSYYILGEYSDRLPRVRWARARSPASPAPRRSTPSGPTDPGGTRTVRSRPTSPLHRRLPGAPRGARPARPGAGGARDGARRSRRAVRGAAAARAARHGRRGIADRDGEREPRLSDRLFLARGHPVGRFHQFWTRPELWFEDAEGSSVWTASNAAWDFELAPWIEKGQLRWIRPGDAELRVIGGGSGERCPVLGLPGDRQPQVLAAGKRRLEEPPDGTPPDPFE